MASFHDHMECSKVHNPQADSCSKSQGLSALAKNKLVRPSIQLTAARFHLPLLQTRSVTYIYEDQKVPKAFFS